MPRSIKTESFTIRKQTVTTVKTGYLRRYTVSIRSVSNRIIGRSNTDRIISVSQTNRILIEYAMLPCTVNRPFLQRKFSKFCYYSGRVLQSSCTEGNTFETTKYFRHIKNAHSHIMFMFAKYE